MMRLFIAIASVIGSAAIFAVEADTNVVVATEKCAQTTPACMGVPVSDTAVARELKEEVKDAATAAEAQYEKRYDELVKAHDRFMVHLDISLGILATLVTIFGAVLPMIMQERAIARINRKEGEIDKRIDEGVSECKNMASRVEKSAKEDVDKVLQMVWKTQVISTHQALKSTLFACKESNWAFSRVCHSDIIREILALLKWLSYITDRLFAMSHFRKLATELKMFRDNTVHIPEWQCKEGNAQTSDVRINLEWCAEACESDYKFVQEVLHSLGIKVLEIDC